MADFMYAKLRGKIREVYGTDGKLAEALGISNVSVSRKLNGWTQFSSEDIRRWCVVLNIPIEDAGLYFFD